MCLLLGVHVRRARAPSNPTTKIPSISCVHKVAVGEVVAWLGCAREYKIQQNIDSDFMKHPIGNSTNNRVIIPYL